MGEVAAKTKSRFVRMNLVWKKKQTHQRLRLPENMLRLLKKQRPGQKMHHLPYMGGANEQSSNLVCHSLKNEWF